MRQLIRKLLARDFSGSAYMGTAQSLHLDPEAAAKATAAWFDAVNTLASAPPRLQALHKRT